MLTETERAALRLRLYPDYERLVFAPVEAALQQYLRPGAIVLDAGGGPGTWILRHHRATIGRWVGVDLYRPASCAADAFVLGDLARLPFAAHSFDLIVCYMVVEHLADPAAAFANFARVLRPGGALILKTPNVRSPLMRLSRLLPVGAHRWFKRGLGVDDADVFPTLYRCNTAPALHQALTAAGFSRQTLLAVDQAGEYFAFNRLTYTCGLLYSRLMQALPVAQWRSSLIAIYTR